MAGIQEGGVVAEPFGVNPFGPGFHFGQRGHWNELTAPLRGHGRGGNTPKFFVVGNHKMTRDALSKKALAPFFEMESPPPIERFVPEPLASLPHTLDTFANHLGREAVQICLKRVGRGDIVRMDPRLALTFHPVARQQTANKCAGVGVMQMEQMACKIKGKTTHRHRSGGSAGRRFPVNDDGGRGQVIRAGKPGQTGAGHDDGGRHQ